MDFKDLPTYLRTTILDFNSKYLPFTFVFIIHAFHLLFSISKGYKYLVEFDPSAEPNRLARRCKDMRGQSAACDGCREKKYKCDRNAPCDQCQKAMTCSLGGGESKG